MKSCVVVLSFLWCLVEVHSQTFPYVSFMGENLTNHSYVNLTVVGEDDSDPGNIVRCHTDLPTCCTYHQGIHRGDWYFPSPPHLHSEPHFYSNEYKVKVQRSDRDIYETRSDHGADLHHRNNEMEPSGLYHCYIPTVAVHDINDSSVRDIVYVGLYAYGGDLFFIFVHAQSVPSQH